MDSLRLLAAVLTANVFCVLSVNGSGFVSNCTNAKKTLDQFEDEFLLGGKFSFAQNSDQIVLITNVATF